MSAPLFIARRLRHAQSGPFSRLISQIAIGSIALGLCAMLISKAIFNGFQHEIREKIFSLSGHIEVTKVSNQESVEVPPLSTHNTLSQQADQLANVARVSHVSQKAGLLKSSEGEVLGLIFKGITHDFDSVRFGQHLRRGHFVSLADTGYSRDIVISRYVADQLLLDTGSEVTMYFVQPPPKPPRYRRLRVAGIYETYLEDFDRLVILGDQRLVQRLNDWGDTLTGSIEISLQDFDLLDQTAAQLFEVMDYDQQLLKITDKFAHLFDWFAILHQNVIILMSVILTVAAFNIVAIVLILIMERTRMIGLLKVLGATDGQIRRIFILNGIRLLLYGLLIGNVVGLGFCLGQQHFQWLSLDPKSYYLDHVPVRIAWTEVFQFNLLVFGLVAFILIVPARVIGAISPARAVRFR